MWPFAVDAITVVDQLEGLADSDNLLNTWPPDDNLGVGPNHIMEMVNNVGRISSKDGGSLVTFGLRSFFQTTPGFKTTDPRVLYDAASGRWFAAYLESSALSGKATITLSVSTSSDPTGTFCLYKLGPQSFQQDQPTIGVTDDKVVVSYNAFTLPGGVFLGAAFYVINKSGVLSCGTASITTFLPNPSVFSLFPAPSLSGTSRLYMPASVFFSGSTTLTLFAVDGLPGVSAVTVSVLSNLAIRPWLVPMKAPQPGSGVLLDTGDFRITDAFWDRASLWLSGNEACAWPGDTATRTCLRVIEVRTDTTTVRQDMTFGASGLYYFYPAFRSDGAGNLLGVFTRSSASEFASVHVVGRLASDPINTLQGSQLLRLGSGAQTDTAGRMGDYSGAARDPADATTVWVSGEYIRSTAAGDWATYLGQLRFDAIPGPSLGAAVLPGSRAVQVGVAATAFATIIASGSGTGLGCTIAPVTSVPAAFLFQITDTATNLPIGQPNTAVNINGGSFQTFVFAFTPSAPFPSTDVQLSFDCTNTDAAPSVSGLNTILLTATSGPTPDIVALGATPTHDGIVNLPGANGANAMAIATVNVGASASITASADTGNASLPVTLSVCQTNPVTGVCMGAGPAPSVTTQINAGTTPTFALFIQGFGNVPFDPANNRAFIRFKTGGGTTVGSTSAALRTQ